jgi:8-oxo-dGTP diphosphatase
MPKPQDIAAGIIIRGERVLVTRRAKGQKLEGKWEFPGGKLEPGESPQACIVRELDEELGVSVEAGPVLTSAIYSYPGGVINLIAVEVRAACEDLRLTVHDAAEWVTTAELMKLELAPADIPIAEHICGILANRSTEAS